MGRHGFILGGCLTACTASPPPAPPPVPAAPTATRQHTCSPLNLPGSTLSGVSLSDLRAALGRPIDGPEVRALVQRLDPGYAVPEDPAFMGFHDHGITFVAHDGYVEGIDLYGRAYGVRSYRGALPAGVSFDDTNLDVERRLGAPQGCDGKGRCYHFEHGLEVRYGPDACVSTVTVRDPLPIGTAQLQRVQLLEDRRGSVRGFVFTIAYASHYERPTRMAVRLEDEDGVAPPVIPKRDDLSVEGRLGWQITVPAGPRFGQVGAFVPYHALAWAEGEHRVTPTVRVEEETDADGWREAALKARADLLTPRLVSQPACAWHRFGIRTLTVNGTAGDASGVPRPERPVRSGSALAPDLRWQVTRGHRLIHRSAERADRFTGRWNERTPWFRLCAADRIYVGLEDVDVALHDDLGGRSFDIDTLRAESEAGELTPFGVATRITTTKVETRSDEDHRARTR
ncbi:MAG: hypothetical protein AAGN82_17800 [Myxococcota bacterium]